jgi:hypothetical protein
MLTLLWADKPPIGGKKAREQKLSLLQNPHLHYYSIVQGSGMTLAKVSCFAAMLGSSSKKGRKMWSL